MPAEPLPWLYAIARNLWRNSARRDRRRRDLLARYRAPAAGDPGVLEPGELRAALASLSEDDQEVLRLIAWDGLTPAEVAVVLGCSQSAARTRLHRARVRLAKRLGIYPQRHVAPGHKQGDSHDSVEVPS
jgi:RNA polymerase sigma-70 factor, ECF subfamily